MFELDAHEAKLLDTNWEIKSGKDDDPEFAMDCDFEMSGLNTVLDTINTKYRKKFYRKKTSSEIKKEQSPELIEQDEYLVLEMPELDRFITVKFLSDGYTLKFHNQLDQTQIYEEFDDCRVSGIKFKCMEGGSAVVRFRVRVHPSQDQIGRIAMLGKQDRPITLLSPIAKEPSQ